MGGIKMEAAAIKEYFEEVFTKRGEWISQTYPIDRGIKLMISPDQIALALVQAGYYSDLKKARTRVKRHLATDTKEKRAGRCIVSLQEYHDYLTKYKLPQPDSSKGYS
jgi:hypothetical protein